MNNRKQSALWYQVHILTLITALLFSIAIPAKARGAGVSPGRSQPVVPSQTQGPTSAA